MKKVAVIISLLFTACLAKDESMLAPSVYMVDLDYSLKQAYNYVDILDKRVSHTFNDSIWHLKFQNADKNWAIFLNPLVDISVHKTAFTNFDGVNADYVVTNNPSWHKDIPLKESILPAIGTWGDYDFQYPKSFNSVYILKIKSDLSLNYVKLQILGATKDNYTIKYGKLGESTYHTFLVPKDKNYTHTYLAVNSLPLLLNVEPPKGDWQLNFTFGHDSIKYNMGCKAIAAISDSIGLFPRITTNKGNVRVAIDSSKPFNEINYFHAKDLAYVSVEQISNLFCNYDSISEQYIVNPKVTVICLIENNYIKMNALDLTQLSPTGFHLKLQLQNL